MSRLGLIGGPWEDAGVYLDGADEGGLYVVLYCSENRPPAMRWRDGIWYDLRSGPWPPLPEDSLPEEARDLDDIIRDFHRESGKSISDEDIRELSSLLSDPASVWTVISVLES